MIALRARSCSLSSFPERNGTITCIIISAIYLTKEQEHPLYKEQQ